MPSNTGAIAGSRSVSRSLWGGGSGSRPEGGGGVSKSGWGLGHRLEPDVRSPDNSVTCPTIAFQLMRSSSTPGCGKPGYGTDSTTTIRKRWVGALFPTAAQSPHAPWWGDSADASDEFGLNPPPKSWAICMTSRWRSAL